MSTPKPTDLDIDALAAKWAPEIISAEGFDPPDAVETVQALLDEVHRLRAERWAARQAQDEAMAWKARAEAAERERDSARAAAAAMREALAKLDAHQVERNVGCFCRCPVIDGHTGDCTINRALSTDAGREILQERDALRARAERLEAAVRGFFTPGRGIATPEWYAHDNGGEPHRITWNAKLDALAAAIDTTRQAIEAGQFDAAALAPEPVERVNTSPGRVEETPVPRHVLDTGDGQTHYVGDDCPGGHRKPYVPPDFRTVK